MPGPIVHRLRSILSCSPRTWTRKSARPDPGDLEHLSRRILLHAPQVSDEEVARAECQDQGQRLARQEMWQQLSADIRAADTARTATPAGESAALLMAYGARGDVVAVAEDALHAGKPPPSDGITDLETILREEPGDYASALVVATAHVDIGWAWQHSGLPEGTAYFRHHFYCAAEALAPFSSVECNSPSLAAAQCSLLAGQEKPATRIADEFEDLIDLDPANPRHMRALGEHLLPARFGTFETLEIEARRTAARTGDVWGAGAYAWVYFDALSADRLALEILDADFFVEGLRDILTRTREQHTANLVAAFCAVTMARYAEESAVPDLPPRAEAARARLHDCVDWVLADHLHELHPLIWSQALLYPGLVQPLPSRKALVTKGRMTALRAIAARFADDIAEGNSIAFSPDGLHRLPPA